MKMPRFYIGLQGNERKWKVTILKSPKNTREKIKEDVVKS